MVASTSPSRDTPRVQTCDTTLKQLPNSGRRAFAYDVGRPGLPFIIVGPKVSRRARRLHAKQTGIGVWQLVHPRGRVQAEYGAASGSQRANLKT